ncbi:MAG: hypothetical protein E7221_05445 [Clostridiales bacterium]|nr:hypothetical protein [Clostridiales bacterium]
MKTESNTTRYSDLYQQKFLDAFPPEMISELSENQKRCLRELKELVMTISLEETRDKPKRFQNIAQKLRDEHPDEWRYEIAPEELQTEEVLFLIVYPFWSRMGGSFENRFALDGRLGKYLRILKKCEMSK